MITVPYLSDSQRKYFNANKKKLEKQGVSVDEWNKSSKGLKLPKKVKKKGGAKNAKSRKRK